MILDDGGSTQMTVGNQLINTQLDSKTVPTILTVKCKDSLKLIAVPKFIKLLKQKIPIATYEALGENFRMIDFGVLHRQRSIL